MFLLYTSNPYRGGYRPIYKTKSPFEALAEISKWNNLEELDVGWSGMDGVGPREFEAFAKNCTKLRKVP